MSSAYIALGSNLAQPAQQLRRAAAAIAELPGCRIQAISPVFRSAAVGPGQQPDYLNAVLALATELAPLDLLEALQGIERAQGRERLERWGPRTLDLDILLYDQLQQTTERLTLPHPRLGERNFVLYPLLAIAGPNLVLPDGTELGTLVARCPRGTMTETDLSLAGQAVGQTGRASP